jgi:hypothetical protein
MFRTSTVKSLQDAKYIFSMFFYFVTIVANKIDELDFCGICKKKF